MTIVLREALCQDTTGMTYSPPTFQGRAILAYGHAQNTHGKTALASNVNCHSSWGGCDETPVGVWGGASFGVTGAGSLETGAGGFQPTGSQFFGNGGGSVATNLSSPVFNCGTLDYTATNDAADYVGLFILGGVTLETAVGYGQFSGTGTHAVTGLGFQPDLILMSGSGHTFTGGASATSGGYNGGFGAADGSGNQFAVAAGSSWNAGTSGSRICRTVNDACFLQVQPALMKANLVSMDMDGFTLNVSTYSSTEYFYWVAIHDPNGNFKVGTMTEGDASISPGFTPEALMFASAGNSAFATTQNGCGLAYGGASSDGTALSGWGAGAAGNITSARYWQTKALSWITHPNAGGVVSEAEADISSWGSTTSFNWTTGPGANTIKAGWVAMQTSTGAGYAGCGSTFIPQIYRRRGGAR